MAGRQVQVHMSFVQQLITHAPISLIYLLKKIHSIILETPTPLGQELIQRQKSEDGLHLPHWGQLGMLQV